MDVRVQIIDLVIRKILQSTQATILSLYARVTITNLPALTTNSSSGVKEIPRIPLSFDNKELGIMRCAIELSLPVGLLDIRLVKVHATTRRAWRNLTPWTHNIEGEGVR